MATYTENYSLVKPGYGDQADIDVLNRLMTDKVDALLFENRRISADEYDQTETYAVGDYAIYENVLYKCLEDTTGNFDPSKWEMTNLAKEVSTKGGADVTKTASGNPIEITDGADAPLVKCVSAITGSQDLHGYDKPWVGGAWKNKLPWTISELKSQNTNGTWNGNEYTYNGITAKVYTNAEGSVTGVGFTGTASNVFLFSLNYTIKAGSYVLTGCPAGGGLSNLYSLRILNTSTQVQYAQDTGSGASFTLSEDTPSSTYIAINAGYSTTVEKIYYPMIRLSTETDPTYSPYSNICPITAYTEGEIEVRGKNAVVGKISETNISAQGVISNYLTSDRNFDMQIARVRSGITYTVTTNDDSGFVGGFFTSVPELGSVSYNGARIVTSNKTFIAPINGYVAFRTLKNYATPQCEEGTTATTYEPYTSTTHTTTYPSAIYRGSEDVVNGSAETEWGMIDLGTLNWRDTPDGWTQIATAITNILPCSNAEKAHIISDRYETETANVVYARTKVAICLNQSNIIQLFDSSFANMTGAQIASALQGSQLAYELATPTTSSVTPTNLPIRTLSGYNHIESSTGDMEVEYITEEYQPLVDLIQSNKHVYSTAEQIVGTWTDGSTVYEKTLYYATLNVSRSDWTILEAFTLDKLIDATVSFTNNTRYLDESYMRISFFNGNIYYHTPEINGTCDDVYVTVRYTKPSSNTRSLNLTKSAVTKIPDEMKNAEYEEKPDVNEADDSAPTEVDER